MKRNGVDEQTNIHIIWPNGIGFCEIFGDFPSFSPRFGFGGNPGCVESCERSDWLIWSGVVRGIGRSSWSVGVEALFEAVTS